MSKQHTKPSTSNRLRRGLAAFLSLALLIGLLPASVIPAQAAEHWATPYVNTLVDWGVMRGDISGNMAPERSITRAEFVAMMNRAYGYTRTAGHPFTDVRVRDWYNDDIDIGYNMGYFKGTSPTTASPNATLTREQAAVLLARNMMLQPTVGETLGFSDTRTLSEWSRGLVGAAAANGILGGYSDGSFKPQTNITRGEVAAMLVRAIGTPIQEEGDHTLGNVYGNVTVNTSGVKLRDGVITGNLYLTGGIDLGDVLMENITVLGDIVVSGAGESNSSQSSIILRNVTADSMTVASISDQFVTIRAEGNTDIKTTTVRTNAYVDDSSLDGYGLWKIIQDGGSLLQLAGNIKEVINQTPNSDLQVVQGVANKVTVDEKATGSSVLVDGDARVNELNLDVGTNVTGDGDIKNLNVAAAGSTVEQLPDTVTIRPGITADINGSTTNSTQAAEISSEPMLLAGYPRAKNVAPTTATLVFSVNKPGTIYWAISAVSDGSVGEADLIENPAYGGKIVKSGTISAAKANTEYTANVTGLTQDGSYYISAILVDGRDKRSPVKVTAFTTPDGTAPAFVGTPTATLRSTKTAQVTGMPNKSCQLFWALLPENATAPTPAEFKANAVRGNLGYGSMDVTKNVSQSVNVNRGALKEKTNYVAYLWLTDYDGAKSSQVYRVPIYIPDETPPEVSGVRQSNSDATSVEVSFTMNETGKLYWAIVTDEMHEKQSFISYDEVVGDPSPATEATNAYLSIENENTALSSKVSVVTGVGAGAIVAGNTPVNTAGALTQVLMNATRGLDPEKYNTSTFYMYYVGEDSEKPGNLSKTIGVKEINVKDVESPVLEAQRFDDYNPNDLEHPLSTTSVSLVFSESIRNDLGTDRDGRFWDLYQKVATLVDQKVGEDHPDLIKARDDLAKALYNCIKLYEHVEGGQREVTSVRSSTDTINPNSPPVLNYRYATVTKENGTSRMIITFPYNTVFKDAGGNAIHSANLKSGATYHFELSDIYDCAAPTPNALQASSDCMKDYVVDSFRVAFARVSLDDEGILPSIMQLGQNKDGTPIFQARNNNTDQGELVYPVKGDAGYQEVWDRNQPQRIDGMFNVTPLFVPSDLSAEDGTDSPYDILVWANSNMQVSLYSRTKTDDNSAPWTLEGTVEYKGTGTTSDGYVYKSLMRDFRGTPSYDNLSTLPAQGMQYAIHVDWLLYGGENSTEFASWDKTVDVKINMVAGSNTVLNRLFASGGSQTTELYKETFDRGGLSSLGIPDTLQTKMDFKRTKVPDIISVIVAKSDATRPQITVTLDNPGHVNYLLVPLTYDRLRYVPKTTGPGDGPSVPGEETVMPSTKRITADMLTNSTNDYFITRYVPDTTVAVRDGDSGELVQPGLGMIEPIKGAGTAGKMGTLVEYPLASAIGGGEEFASPMQQGYTAETAGNRAQPIPLKEDLTPNTLYLLFLVPVGNREAEETRAFYFITDPVSAPVLTLGERGSINVDATVNMTANVHARLLRQDSLSGAETIFDEELGKTGGDGSSNWNYDNDADNAANYMGYTVLQALQETYRGDNTGRSVFDVFASDTLKGRIANAIMAGNNASTNPPFPGQTFYGNWQDSIQVPNGADAATKPTTFDENTVDSLATYLCLAMAYVGRSEATGPWGFRALSDLSLVDDREIKISGVSPSLTYIPPDPDDRKDLGTINGRVYITFTNFPHLPDPRPGHKGEYLPVAVTSKNGETTSTNLGTLEGTNGDRFVPLGPAMLTLPSNITLIEAVPPYVRSETIGFEITDVRGDSFVFDIPVLYSQWGRHTSAGTIMISYVNGSWRVTVTPSSNLATGYNPNAR